MRTKETHYEDMIKSFNKIMEEYGKEEIGVEEAIMNGAMILKFYFESSHHEFRTSFLNIEQFCKALDETQIGKKFRTNDKRYLQGCLIEGIRRFGGVKEQCYKFMIDFCNITRTECIESSKIFNKYYFEKEGLQDQSNEEFLDYTKKWMFEFIKEAENKESKSINYTGYKKAYHAFKSYKKSIDEALQEESLKEIRSEMLRPFKRYNSSVLSYDNLIDED